jgi:formamidopyrimidine-DNA glycosylase
MPELPEVEVLVRHLRPLVRGRTIRGVEVRRARILAPTVPGELKRRLAGATFTGLRRRGKYLLFELKPPRGKSPIRLLGHLGMTGRIYLSRRNVPLPKHAAVVLALGGENFIFEDTRYFGRLTLDTSAVERLGPEPLGRRFTTATLAEGLARSAQAVKIKLLDQTLVAGVGNIYASEALFRARISPLLPARDLDKRRIHRLWLAIRQVLRQAIRFGSTVPLSYDGAKRNGLFYFGSAADAENYYEERLRVYDRAGQPCPRCGSAIRRIVQAARSTFYCAKCQKS